MDFKEVETLKENKFSKTIKKLNNLTKLYERRKFYKMIKKIEVKLKNTRKYKKSLILLHNY
jgi:predicted signal transduction protein with EAL and GGDEF domain